MAGLSEPLHDVSSTFFVAEHGVYCDGMMEGILQ
jgi:hypothetical protein